MIIPLTEPQQKEKKTRRGALRLRAIFFVVASSSCSIGAILFFNPKNQKEQLNKERLLSSSLIYMQDEYSNLRRHEEDVIGNNKTSMLRRLQQEAKRARGDRILEMSKQKSPFQKQRRMDRGGRGGSADIRLELEEGMHFDAYVYANDAKNNAADSDVHFKVEKMNQNYADVEANQEPQMHSDQNLAVNAEQQTNEANKKENRSSYSSSSQDLTENEEKKDLTNEDVQTPNIIAESIERNASQK